MSSRMDKYKNQTDIPMRSDKNKTLYKQIYNAYDEFENLIVPPNSREIDMNDLKKEITSREEYRNKKIYNDITKNNNNSIKRKEIIKEVESKETEIYDINKLLNKAVSENKETNDNDNLISNGDYLKKLKLDSRKTNIEQVKEMYEDIKEENDMEEEGLLKTANLSLEILSDLKSDNDSTMVSAPIKNEELPKDSEEDFYSNNYKFSKKDFEDKDNDTYEEENEEEDIYSENGNGKLFLKVFLLIFGALLIIGVLVFFVLYFNKA